MIEFDNLSPCPLPLVREGGENLRGGEAPSLLLFPLSLLGDGDKGGEVE
jgi:hypothetical protein